MKEFKLEEEERFSTYSNKIVFQNLLSGYVWDGEKAIEKEVEALVEQGKQTACEVDWEACKFNVQEEYGRYHYEGKYPLVGNDSFLDFIYETSYRMPAKRAYGYGNVVGIDKDYIDPTTGKYRSSPASFLLVIHFEIRPQSRGLDLTAEMVKKLIDEKLDEITSNVKSNFQILNTEIEEFN